MDNISHLFEFVFPSSVIVCDGVVVSRTVAITTTAGYHWSLLAEFSMIFGFVDSYKNRRVKDNNRNDNLMISVYSSICYVTGTWFIHPFKNPIFFFSHGDHIVYVVFVATLMYEKV